MNLANWIKVEKVNFLQLLAEKMKDNKIFETLKIHPEANTHTGCEKVLTGDKSFNDCVKCEVVVKVFLNYVENAVEKYARTQGISCARSDILYFLQKLIPRSEILYFFQDLVPRSEKLYFRS